MFSNNLKKLRCEKGLNQAELSVYANVPIRYITDMEQGCMYPYKAIRERLTSFFNVSEDQLFPQKPKVNEALLLARKRRGLFQKDLGKAAGVPSWYVSKYEDGTYCGSPTYQKKLSKALGISYRELFPRALTHKAKKVNWAQKLKEFHEEQKRKQAGLIAPEKLIAEENHESKPGNDKKTI
jgi:transcriptional regulator with XRE-family HTH domain